MISVRNSVKLSTVRNYTLPVAAEGRKCFSISAKAHNKEYPPNSSLEVTSVYNRNPRNLERLRIGEKPGGWTLDVPGKCFWNKLTLSSSGKHVSARVDHYLGTVPVKASTHEWCIKRHLHSTKDVTAVHTIGRVLAQRCLQAGIIEVATFFTEEELKKEKIKLFTSALEESGIVLTETIQLRSGERAHVHFPYLQEKSWEVFEELDEKILSKLEKRTKSSSVSSS